MATYSVTVEDEEVRELIHKVRASGKDSTPAMRAIGQDISERVRSTFMDGSDPWGRSWPGLVDTFRSGQPLLDTGVLRNSITNTATRGTVRVGTNVLYANLQQFGGTVLPVRAKRLSIPMTPQARRAGGASKYQGNLTMARRLVGARIATVLIDDGGTVQYMLVKSSKVPARPFFPINGSNQLDFPQTWNDGIVDAMKAYVQAIIE